MLSSTRQDLAYAVRCFTKTPVLTATIIISIALGIAANTAVFSLVNELLIRDLPVRDPARLYVVEPGRHPSSSLPQYLDFRDQTGQVFDQKDHGDIAGREPFPPEEQVTHDHPGRAAGGKSTIQRRSGEECFDRWLKGNNTAK